MRPSSMRSITRAVCTAWLAEPTPSMWSGAGTRYGDGVFDETVIAEAGRRLLEAAPPRTRVILFGSHARGKPVWALSCTGSFDTKT
jgi:hypothetical protein